MHPSKVLEAKDIIQNSHHNGENPPHMCWSKFEQLLNNAHSVMRRKCGAECHPEEMKVRSLLKKIKDPDLEHIHCAVIQRQMDRPNCTCPQAMADIEIDAVRGHPDSDDDNKDTRQVKQTTAKKHQNCEHQNNKDCNHGEPGTIALTNGKQIKHHHSHWSDDADFRLFAPERKRTLTNERQAAKQNDQGHDHNQNHDQNRGSNQRPSDWKKESQEERSRIVSSLVSRLEDSSSIISAITQQNSTPPGLPSFVMGGRNSKNQKNCSGRTE